MFPHVFNVPNARQYFITMRIEVRESDTANSALSYEGGPVDLNVL